MNKKTTKAKKKKRFSAFTYEYKKLYKLKFNSN